MKFLVISLILTSRCFADINITEHCYRQAHLVKDEKGNYSIVKDKEETCESTANDWKED